MMNLNDIKGVIEINGESYDPRDIIKALLAQGLKIHPLNGSLLVGRTFIDPSPNIETTKNSCPISDHCKIYDRLSSDIKSDEEGEFPTYDLERGSSLSEFLDQSPSSNRTYVDPLDIDMDNYNVKDLFSSQIFDDSSPQIENVHGDSLLDENFEENYNQEPTEMMGMSPATRYGLTSNINLANIPAKYRGKCPHCKSIVNVKWKYCGTCGSVIG